MHTSPRQAEFDKKWISAGELRKKLEVSTATLCLAIKRGNFPSPDVRIGKGIGLWDRDKIQSAIADWKKSLGRLRGMRHKILTQSSNPPWNNQGQMS
jgi:hypothetical protein